jgi:hypothetical protein
MQYFSRENWKEGDKIEIPEVVEKIILKCMLKKLGPGLLNTVTKLWSL